jgi:flagella basal body P-ring formation protein FlgA
MRNALLTTLLIILAPQVWATDDTATRTYPTTTQTVMKGYILTPSDITTAEVGNLVLPKTAVMDEAGLVGMEVVRPLRAGMPILRDSLRQPPEAYKGKTVTITLSKPGMEITTSGKALQDGYTGDSIRVFSNLNQKVINATVVSPGVVTLN